jgi:ribose-phosphate pyrophosphokinase
MCSSSMNGYGYDSSSLPSLSLPFPIPAPRGVTSTSIGGRLRIFSGSANPVLAQEIAYYLGMELGKIKIKRFADGEIYV